MKRSENHILNDLEMDGNRPLLRTNSVFKAHTFGVQLLDYYTRASHNTLMSVCLSVCVFGTSTPH